MLLHGTDYFQLLIDHHSKRQGGPGHQAGLAIWLAGHVEEHELRKMLDEHPDCRRLQQVRVVKTNFIGVPEVKVDEPPKPVSLFVHRTQTDEIPSQIFQESVDVYHGPPLSIHLIESATGNCCIYFSFHHILFDFAGVTALIKSLAGGESIPLLPLKRRSPGISQKLQNFFKAIRFTFVEANWNMMIPGRMLPQQKKQQVVFHETFLHVKRHKPFYSECSQMVRPLTPAYSNWPRSVMLCIKISFVRAKDFYGYPFR